MPAALAQAGLRLNRLLFLTLLTALTFSACAPRSQDCARADVVCVGLVTASGSIEDTINQQAWLGLQDAKAEKLVDRIDYIETIDSRDREQNIAFFTQRGYDVIITVGASIANETVSSATRNPKILFIGVEQPQPTKYPNLTGLIFHEENSGFLAGALAAMITQTNHVAAVCEEKFIDPMRRYCDGFKEGVLYIDPKITTDVVYRDGASENLFNDPVWAKTTTLQVVHNGADVVMAAGGSTGDSALETAAQEGAMVIGTETDVYTRLPDLRQSLVTSAVSGIRSGVLELMRMSRTGQFPSGEFFGQVGLAPFHEWDSRIPQTVKDRLLEIEKSLNDQSIQPNVPYIAP